MFIGRKSEVEKLRSIHHRVDSSITVLYGRRRVGKSRLIREAFKNEDVFYFEGIEAENTESQIKNFKNQLSRQISNGEFLRETNFTSWDAVFSYFTQSFLGSKKTIIVFDELQWMAAKRTKLISLIKYFWDNYWKNQKVTLILCGSIASFMVQRVINSKALYGRISQEIKLDKFLPNEISKFLPNRSKEEAIKYALTLGGVPKYLEEINQNRSFDININKLCFQKDSLMSKEFERIFYSQFQEATNYLKIINSISKKPLTFDQILKASKQSSGGGFKSYLTNLEQADFIRKKILFGKTDKSKITKYYISDQFLSFYFKFIKQNLKSIQINTNNNLFQKLVKPNWDSWLGYAFERYCYQHADYVAEKLGFLEDLEEFGTLYEKKSENFQIDLIFKRFDKVIVVTEVKFHNKEISTSIIPEIEKKISLLEIPKGYTIEKALISTYGESKPLKNSKYFSYSLDLESLLS